MFSLEISKEQRLTIHYKCSGLSFNSSKICRKMFTMKKFSEMGVLAAFSNQIQEYLYYLYDPHLLTLQTKHDTFSSYCSNS